MIEWLIDPSITYLLLILGIYGLLIEFFHPGIILPGLLGAIAFIFALYGLHFFPISYAALAFIILGIICFTSEIFVPTHGFLGTGGTLAFILGSIFLIKAHNGYPGVPWQIILVMSLINISFITLLIYFVLKVRSRPKISGKYLLLGKTGEIVKVEKEHEPWVLIEGELWQCTAKEPVALHQKVMISEVSELHLTVVPLKHSES